MKKRVCQIVVIAAFLIIIAAPLAALQQPGRASVVENKATATWPALSEYDLLDARFTAAVDTFFSDNIGFKDEATILNISAMYRLFGRIAIAGYMEGKDGHVLYLPEGVLASYQGLDRVPEAEMARLAQDFTALDEAVKDAGSRFIFMPIPNKDTVYREYVPESIHVLSEDSFLHSLKEHLLAGTDVPVADVETALLAHKGDGELLYYRNVDPTHWNDRGAFIGYQSLMETMAALDPSISYPREEEVSFSSEEVHNAIQFLSSYKLIRQTFYGLTDREYTVSLPEEWQYGQSDSSVPEDYSLANDELGRYRHYHNDGAPGGHSVAILGDSYIFSYLLPQISVGFEDVYFIDANVCGGAEVGELLNCLPERPDFFVLEAAARQVWYQRLSDLSCELTEVFRSLVGAAGPHGSEPGE